MHLRHDGGHVLQVGFRQHRLLEVVGVAPVHAVFVGRVADDFLFLHRRDMAGVDTQGDAIFFPKMRQDSLLIGGGRILPQCPHTAVGVATDEVVSFKLDNGGRDHVQKLLNMHILRSRRRGGSRSFQMDTSLILGIEKRRTHFCIRRMVNSFFCCYINSIPDNPCSILGNGI